MCRYASHGFTGHLRRVPSHVLGAAVGQGCGWAEYLKAQLRWVPTKRRRAVTVDTFQFMARADWALSAKKRRAWTLSVLNHGPDFRRKRLRKEDYQDHHDTLGGDGLL